MNGGAGLLPPVDLPTAEYCPDIEDRKMIRAASNDTVPELVYDPAGRKKNRPLPLRKSRLSIAD
jgi:hypothetical protein